MHLFNHINCYPYLAYFCCYPISPCCYPYYQQREEVYYKQTPIHNGHEHGKG
jgi:hypothetical protein